MKLSDYLDESGITFNIAGNDKSSALKSLVDTLAQKASLKNPSAILEALEIREKLKTTGIGSGIAIPHCKSADVESVHIVVGLSKDGVDFESLDNSPAMLFFLLVAPENAGAEHLKASAKIVRLVRDDTVRQDLLQLDSAADVLQYIKEKEQELS